MGYSAASRQIARRNIFGWSKKERTAKRKRHSAASTDARGAGFRYGSGKSDENFTEWLDRKDFGGEKQAVKERLAAAFSMGYERGRAQVAGKERIQRKREEFTEKKIQKRIEALDRKTEQAEKKLDQVSQRASKGTMSEAQFEAVKARLEKEIQQYEAQKRAARNPSWGYGIYQGKGFQTRQIAHFGSRAAAETYARSHGLTGYSIKRAFAKGENPAVSGAQYRLAQAVLSGTARQTHMSKEAAREIVDRTPASLRSRFSKRNPALEFSTEYHLGYNLGQADRQSAQLRKTLDELHATFAANFPPDSLASWESFEQAYQAGYGPGAIASAENPDLYEKIQDHLSSGGVVAVRTSMRHTNYLPKHAKMFKPGKSGESGVYVQRGKHWDYVFPEYIHFGRYKTNPKRGNPETDGDNSEEYAQAKRTAELFHGRPVKEEIEVEEKIRTHDWYVSIGPLIKLVIKPVTKKPRKRVPLPFHQSESGQVQLFCSPDGLQFYLRGGDQELDLDAFGMGPESAWYRDHMLIGEAVEVTYRDRKKFHSFKLIDYFHKLGEQTRVKPTLAYDSLSKKLSIIGGQYRIEMEDLVDGMSPGIVN
jgi:hypothetical protein